MAKTDPINLLTQSVTGYLSEIQSLIATIKKNENTIQSLTNEKHKLAFELNREKEKSGKQSAELAEIKNKVAELETTIKTLRAK